MFKGVEKTFTLNCINCNKAVTGAGAVVRDSSTGLSGVVWIDADTHTWNNGVSTMALTVTLKQIMDIKQPTTNPEKDDNKNSSSSSGNKGNSNSYTPTYGSKSNPPYEVVNNYWRLEKGGFGSYANAFNYYSQSGGSSKGWKILDKDRKEVQI